LNYDRNVWEVHPPNHQRVRVFLDQEDCDLWGWLSRYDEGPDINQVFFPISPEGRIEQLTEAI